MNKINYYSHLLLNSRYSLLIKLVILFSIYTLFYIDSSADIAYCTKSKAVNLKKQNTELQHEIFALKNELTRFRMSVDPNSYRELDTLETLKDRIASYRERNVEGFLTVEEQESPKHVTHKGAERSDLKLSPDFFISTEYKEITSRLVFPYNGFFVEHVFIDETGKEVIDLSKTYRLQSAVGRDGFSRFQEVRKWPFYDYKEYYREVYYPANHPDNNFDPQYKRLRKLVGYEFYEKQIPDKISSKIVDNCNIS